MLECPVCYDPLGETTDGPVANNALGCPRGHNVCTSCLRKLVKPCRLVPTGLAFWCPLCRTGTAVSRLQFMVLLKGSWKEAHACFECDDAKTAWVGDACRKDWSPAALQCV